MTQARTQCRRCNHSFADHGLEHNGELCPDGSGRTFKKRVNNGFSQSFTPEQIDAADMLIRRSLQLKDLAGVVRHKGFKGFAQKFQSMKKRAALKVT